VQPNLPLTREVLDKSRKVILLTDALQDAIGPIGGSVPVAIVAGADAWEECAEELDDLLLGDAEVRLVPVRSRSRYERRSLRTFSPVVALRPRVACISTLDRRDFSTDSTLTDETTP
jgi:hypothetical protein